MAVCAVLAAYAGNVAYKGLQAKLDGLPVTGALRAATTILWSNHSSVFLVATLFLVLHTLVLPRAIWMFIFRYRYAIAGATFLLCVVLQINGSSLAMWQVYVQPTVPAADSSIPLLGVPRAIRSDEWLSAIPLTLSQNFTGYSVINDLSSASPLNVLAVANQPVWDLTVLCKPFLWGYLLFGSGAGLAWFWCGRFITLFLVSFEFFRILTHDRRPVSLAGACLIAWAPAVQWWSGGPVEMLIAGMGMALLLRAFLTHTETWKRIGYTVLFGLAASAYMFTLYPAWLVPLVYIFIAVLVVVFLDCRRDAGLRWWHFLYLIGALLIIGTMAVYWYLRSHDAIQVMLSTAYPGARFETGGWGLGLQFDYVSNLASPYLTTGNACEGSQFLGFFPLPETIAVYYLVRIRGKDAMVLALAIVQAIFLVFAQFGFPDWLARFSLLYLTTNSRLTPIISLVSLLLLILLISRREKIAPERLGGKVLFTAVCIAVLLTAIILAVHLMRPEVTPLGHLPVFYLALFFVAAVMLASPLFLPAPSHIIYPIFAIVTSLIALIGGAVVNPTMRGITAVTDRPLYTAIQQIETTAPGTWIGTGLLGDYIIMAGAPSITSTNFLPVIDRWSQFDPTGENDATYNRYAHVFVQFTTEPTSLTNPQSDVLLVLLNPADLTKLDADYICTTSDTVIPSTPGVTLTVIYNEAGIVIYRVE